jgi:hypothetical protein
MGEGTAESATEEESAGRAGSTPDHLELDTERAGVAGVDEQQLNYRSGREPLLGQNAGPVPRQVMDEGTIGGSIGRVELAGGDLLRMMARGAAALGAGSPLDECGEFGVKGRRHARGPAGS